MMGRFFNPRSFILDQTSFSRSPRRQASTSFVITAEAVIVQLHP
jgi:hypothetical protein